MAAAFLIIMILASVGLLIYGWSSDPDYNHTSGTCREESLSHHTQLQDRPTSTSASPIHTRPPTENSSMWKNLAEDRQKKCVEISKELENTKEELGKVRKDLSKAQNDLAEANRELSIYKSNLTAIPYMAAIMADFETYHIEVLAKQLDWGHSWERSQKVLSIREIRKEAKKAAEKNLKYKYCFAYLTELYPVLKEILRIDYKDIEKSDFKDISFAAVNSNALNEKQQRIDELASEVQDLTKKVTSLSSEVTELSSKNNRLLRCLDNARDLDKKLVDAQRNLEQAEKVIAELQATREVPEEFRHLLTESDSLFKLYWSFARFYVENQPSITRYLSSFVHENYPIGKTDIASHLTQEHIASVSVPDVTLSASVVIQGSAGRYRTTLSDCSCPDFRSRHRPCKHMIALAEKCEVTWLYGAYFRAEIDYRLDKFKNILAEHEEKERIFEEDLKSRRAAFEKQLKADKRSAFAEIREERADLERQRSGLTRKKAILETKEKAITEKSQAYPWLASRFASLEIASENVTIQDKITKEKAKSMLRKQAKTIAMLENQLAFYEYTFPILEEFKEVEPKKAVAMISEGVRNDEYQYQWLSEDEYDVLTSQEKSEIWIQRYFHERSKTAWEAGIKYERYIGFLCEKEGYTVKYNGALMHKEDMGRDLIVSKGKQLYVIQCKRLSFDKEVHENHVFQLLGSVVHLRSKNPNKTVRGVFVTSTVLSPVARECAEVIGLTVFENVKFQAYPIIKCNIGRDGKKIYHLPYDQQYDRIRIEPEKGELYASTCSEAEENGFRHAWKHFTS